MHKKIELTPSVSIIIAGVIIALAIFFSNNRAPQGATGQMIGAADGAPAGIPTAPKITPPSATDHIIGSPTAPIVLVEYSDFQCPFCSVVYPTLKRIISESNGQIAWIYRNFPLPSIHPEAAPAANAAECVAEQLGNDSYWKFVDILFANQKSLSSAFYLQQAKTLGVDQATFVACVGSKKYQSKIDAETAEAQANGATGTPFTLVLNTKTKKAAPVSGALPYDQFMSTIKGIQQ